MKKKFWEWVFKLIYVRISLLEQKYYQSGYKHIVDFCAQLRDDLVYIREEIIEGKI